MAFLEGSSGHNPIVQQAVFHNSFLPGSSGHNPIVQQAVFLPSHLPGGAEVDPGQFLLSSVGKGTPTQYQLNWRERFFTKGVV